MESTSKRALAIIIALAGCSTKSSEPKMDAPAESAGMKLSKPILRSDEDSLKEIAMTLAVGAQSIESVFDEKRGILMLTNYRNENDEGPEAVRSSRRVCRLTENLVQEMRAWMKLAIAQGKTLSFQAHSVAEPGNITRAVLTAKGLMSTPYRSFIFHTDNGALKLVAIATLDHAIFLGGFGLPGSSLEPKETQNSLEWLHEQMEKANTKPCPKKERR